VSTQPLSAVKIRIVAIPAIQPARLLSISRIISSLGQHRTG
jgi:hypothetical protein